jgi:TPR repeat protein
MSPSSRSVGRPLVALSLASALAIPSIAVAADKWIQVKSPHFTVVSTAGDRTARSIAWQFEQIRSALATIYPWSKVDLPRPVLVIAVGNEQDMRALIPAEPGTDARSWASIWATGPDQHYILIRGDLKAEDRDVMNPHIYAFFTYASLVLRNSFPGELPLWFERGLAGVLSNTVVRESHMLIGPPIPSHIRRLHERSRMPLPQVVALKSSSGLSSDSERLETFDAQSWALVHYLMFANNGTHEPRLVAFAKELLRGGEGTAAFRETLGMPESYEGPVDLHVRRSIISFGKASLDASVKREAFPVAVLSAAAAAETRASFHVAMNHPKEARAAIAEARRADAASPGSYVAEGLLLEREGKSAEARAAYAMAVERGSSSALAYYRLAMLSYGMDPDRTVLVEIEKHLARAIALDNRFARAYAALAEVRARLEAGREASVSLVRRAIALEPSEPDHYITSARVFWWLGSYDEARREAAVARSLARDDDDRRRVQETVDGIEKARAASQPKPAADAGRGATEEKPGAAEAGVSDATGAACNDGDAAACATLLPMAEAACEKNVGPACAFAGALYETGRGVAADSARAAALYEKACGAGVTAACTQWAVLLAASRRPEHLTRARELLTNSCTGGEARACDLLKSLPSRK